jgi:hypothetical protein
MIRLCAVSPACPSYTVLFACFLRARQLNTAVCCPAPCCLHCTACRPCNSQYKLRLAAMSWFVGSLTYEQLSRLAVASWPYAMRLLFVATEIMQQSQGQRRDAKT